MIASNQNFNLIIEEHFSEILNKIDIQTEELINSSRKNSSDHHTGSSLENDLNSIRANQILIIKEISNFNLKNQLSMKEYNIITRSQEALNSNEALKKIIIRNDCILLDNQKNVNHFELIATSWFINSDCLKFFK